MENAFQEHTSIVGHRIGPWPVEVLEEKLKFYRFLIYGSAGVGLVVSLFLLFVVDFRIALGVAAIVALFSYFAFIFTVAMVPMAVGTNAIVYCGGKWYTTKDAPVWFAATKFDLLRSKAFKLRLGQHRATWQTEPLPGPGGRTFTYDVEMVVEVDVTQKDALARYISFCPEEYIFVMSVRTLLKQKLPTEDRELAKFEDMALDATKDLAARNGLILHQLYIHKPRVQGQDVPTLLSTKTYSAGELQVMNDNELVTTLRRDYGVVVPDLFDPVVIKKGLETLRNRKQPGLIKKVLNRFSGQVPQTERGLLKAWEDYYTQVGATLEANHAAQKKLEQAEVNHQLFLEKSMAIVRDLRAKSADADARTVEAAARAANAAADIVGAEVRAKRYTQKLNEPAPQKKTSAENEAEAHAQYRAEVDGIDSQVAQGNYDEETAHRMKRLAEDRHNRKINQLHGYG